ncbi:Membrane metallo-endopeptidase-like 1 [Mycena kentingensis (nom. inval.)]|nr:Membrane metallo-endopeptidase-like 1 [Mycena kentingensis (nom. inval.)]
MHLPLSLLLPLAIASTAHAAQIKFYAGADCTGSLTASHSLDPGFCFYLSESKITSGKSIGFNGVPAGHKIYFFESGGEHDVCTGHAQTIVAKTDGCVTAPVGVNWESIGIAPAITPGGTVDTAVRSAIGEMYPNAMSDGYVIMVLEWNAANPTKATFYGLKEGQEEQDAQAPQGSLDADAPSR